MVATLVVEGTKLAFHVVQKLVDFGIDEAKQARRAVRQEAASKDDAGDKLRNGHASVKYKDGKTYAGLFCNGLHHGEGRLEAGAYSYTGHFCNGLPHGHGTLKKGKITFEGEFVCGELVQGRLTDEGSTASYDGGFKSLRFSGEGRYVFEDGNVFEGGWLEGNFHGSGKLCRGACEIAKAMAGQRGAWLTLSGEWRGGQLHGEAKLAWASGGTFEGEVRDGEMHRGKKVTLLRDGRVAEMDGEFADGRLVRGTQRITKPGEPEHTALVREGDFNVEDSEKEGSLRRGRCTYTEQDGRRVELEGSFSDGQLLRGTRIATAADGTSSIRSDGAFVGGKLQGEGKRVDVRADGSRTTCEGDFDDGVLVSGRRRREAAPASDGGRPSVTLRVGSFERLDGGASRLARGTLRVLEGANAGVEYDGAFDERGALLGEGVLRMPKGIFIGTSERNQPQQGVYVVRAEGPHRNVAFVGGRT